VPFGLLLGVLLLVDLAAVVLLLDGLFGFVAPRVVCSTKASSTGASGGSSFDSNALDEPEPEANLEVCLENAFDELRENFNVLLRALMS